MPFVTSPSSSWTTGSFSTQVTRTLEIIREEDEYSGVRDTLTATQAAARLSLYVDINLGDPIWPAPPTVALPRLLGGTIQLSGYPLPMIYAEKIVTALQRGTANTWWSGCSQSVAERATSQCPIVELPSDQRRTMSPHCRVAISPIVARNVDLPPGEKIASSADGVLARGRGLECDQPFHPQVAATVRSVEHAARGEDVAPRTEHSGLIAFGRLVSRRRRLDI